MVPRWCLGGCSLAGSSGSHRRAGAAGGWHIYRGGSGDAEDVEKPLPATKLLQRIRHRIDCSAMNNTTGPIS